MTNVDDVKVQAVRVSFSRDDIRGFIIDAARRVAKERGHEVPDFLPVPQVKEDTYGGLQIYFWGKVL